MLRKFEYAGMGERVFREELPGGLRLTVIPRPGYRKSMAFLAVNYGGADRYITRDGERAETPAGTAHFIEHRMYEMEDGRNALTVMGEHGANANAFTSPDMTAYHFECVDSFFENLELLLKYACAPIFTNEAVERERAIIASEIRMMEDDPEDGLYYALLRCLYESASVRDSVAGTVESIGKVTPELLYACHGEYYRPSNMSLVVVGDQDPKRISDMAKKYLGSDALPPQPRRSRKSEGMTPFALREESARDVGAPMFLAGAKTAYDLRGEASVRFELTATMALSLLMGSASPLYKRLYTEGLINETFGYDFENSAGCSYLSFGGETQNPELVCLRVLDEAAHLAAAGVDREFFSRRSRAVYGSCIRALGSFDSICYNVAAGDFSGYDYFDTLSVLGKVTADDVRAFLGEYLTPDRCAISVITKKER